MEAMKKDWFLALLVLVVLESVAIAYTYYGTLYADHSGKLYGVTYAQDPRSWFAMSAINVHLFALPIEAVAVFMVVSMRREARQRRGM